MTFEINEQVNCNLKVSTAPTVGAARSRPQRNEIGCSVEWYTSDIVRIRPT